MKRTIILLGLLLVATTTLQAQDILQWRNDRTGIYTETGLLKAWPANGPQLLWNYDGLGEGHSSVAISSGKIYLTGMARGKGYLYVLDTTGKLLNKKEYGAEWDKSYNGTRGTVTANEGKLYLLSGHGELVCFNESNLSIVWKKNILTEYDSKNLNWGLNESPLIVGDKLIITPGGKAHNIVALNKNTGTLIWTSEGAGTGDLSAYCSPLYLADQQVPQIVTMTAKHIVGIDVSNGKKLWAFEQVNRTDVHANTPVYGDSMLLCTSGYGKGSAMLRLTNGGRSVEQVWFSQQLDSRIGAMVKVGNYAYGSGDNNRFWFCVDWMTGEIKYKENILPIGNVIAADGMLYCYSDRGDFALAKITPEKFDIVSRFPITLGTNQHWAHSVIYKGVLYVRHGNTLMAYKIS
ncbi:Outer membrane protein assembly factor BamB [termite gut metagenome]|uniref:Outer membrane protein assembly factor BamB n=1 Tax=termite gut metagenome TaxID=433724 RepID=A0A5J4QS71_9ZZZZ